MPDRMHEEWEAWQIVTQELRKLGIEINKQRDLNLTLVAWGNRLAELRLEQADIYCIVE